MNAEALVDALVEIHEILAEADIAHALCGGLAANLYRDDVRATMDVDFYLMVGASKLVAMTRLFEGAGWNAQPSWGNKELLRLTRKDAPRVDLLVATTEFEQTAVARAKRFDVDGHDVPVLWPEDLIVFKLVAGRARDYEAVAAIVNSPSNSVNLDEVAKVLEQLDLGDRWTRALKEAALEVDE